MGATALTFPWVFESPVPVFALAAVAFLMLVAMRHVAVLKSSMDGVIDAVDRVSAGELYFPIGIALSFWLTGGDPLLFCVPILILTLADAVAALVGLRYGTKLYTTLDGTKSYQGSFAFFAMAFVCTYFPLTLYAQIALPEATLIAIITGVLTMIVEAVAWRGLDNLLLPVVGFLLLNSFLKLDVLELVTNLSAIIVLCIITFFYRTRSTLSDDALLTAVLVGYVIWALGGFIWVYPPLLIFLRDKLISYSALGPDISRHNVQSILAICLPGLVWLVAAVVTDQGGLFYPYVLTFAASLAILELTREIHHYRSRPWLVLFASSVGVGWLMFLPFFFITHFGQPWLLLALVAPGPIAVGASLFMLIQPGIDDCPRDLPRWLRQGAASFAASMVGLGLFLLAQSYHG
jgi:phytol kinase